MTGFNISVSGVAVICCVHNRVKRANTNHFEFDPSTEKPHLCACCENLFARPDDVPHYCPQCGGAPVYPLGGPLPDPIGEV